MQQFTESDLIITFPDQWGVRPYDQHTYYRGLSGLGLKGVDFLAIDPAGQLFFVEVKNYRTRTTEEGIFIATPKPAAELARTISRKYQDTREAIRAVYGYYRRSWWFRQAEKWLLSSRRYHFDRVFWTQAYHLVFTAERVTVTLRIALEGKDGPYLNELEAMLKQQLNGHVAVRIEVESLPGPTA